MSVYDEIFYDDQEKGSLNSAKEVLPIILDLIEPNSVIDVGCGLGTWLSVFKEFGVEDIVGLDGNWVDRNRLLIPEENFIATNLENPIDINRNFDLVISLEVAEHINPANADKFIKYLLKAPVIIFSAAIPLQGGTKHINEQWPEYWIEIFRKNNYQVIDCIRDKIWENKGVEVWYRQNMFLFVEKNYLRENKKLKSLNTNFFHPHPIVNPDLYSSRINDLKNILKNKKEELNDQKNHYIKQLQNQSHIHEQEIEKQNTFHEEEIEKQKTVYEQKLFAQNKVIQDLISSNSWKITAPIRKIGNWLKNLK